MTAIDLRQTIEAVLASVPFSPPVTLAYCSTVMCELKRQLPDGIYDVYSRGADFVVAARCGGAKYEFAVRIG
ncbi:MAG TPA: hypothetical protein VNT29_10525 [Candidatus Limnocylindrales bacterium]|nr:hypothetical protein [Candidatus Limnocylindrales bacterium]